MFMVIWWCVWRGGSKRSLVGIGGVGGGACVVDGADGAGVCVGGCWWVLVGVRVESAKLSLGTLGNVIGCAIDNGSVARFLFVTLQLQKNKQSFARL